jgi:quercetin dioxygenase-like cupin family protein
MIAAVPSRTFTYLGATVHEYRANKGEGLPKHSHDYAHLTVCHSGRCIVRKERKEFFIDPTTSPVELRAVEWHEIEAVEDGTVFCNIFPARRV